MPTSVAGQYPKVLPLGKLPTPDHIQRMWRGRTTLPLEYCSRLRSILEMCVGYPAPSHKRKGPTPIADAIGTLTRAIERAQAHWTKAGPAKPGTTAADALIHLSRLADELNAMPLDWLLEPKVTVVQVAWQGVCNALYETALAARIHAGQPAGKPHAKDLTILFLFDLLTAVRLAPDHATQGGCKSPGAISQYLRAGLPGRSFDMLLERIKANDQLEPHLRRAWSTAPLEY